MNAHFGNLSMNASTPPPVFKYTQFLRLPGDPVTRQRFEFRELAIKVREFLTYQVGTHTRDQAARMLWVQGRPGEGKSEGCLVAALNAGFAAAVLSPGMFSGDTEGKSVEVLHDVLADLVRWSEHHKRPVVVVLDDFDLSTANVGDGVGATINSQLLINEFMALADNRHLYRTPYGNIGFIITVNDASGMRESLHRAGRAIWHDHVPSNEDKANIAWSILAPHTSAERELVEALVRHNIRQPVSFWKALYHRMQALQARQLIEVGMPDSGAIDRAYGRRLALNPDVAWAAAKALRSSRVRSFLTKRFGRR
jgi:hypothetical protein